MKDTCNIWKINVMKGMEKTPVQNCTKRPIMLIYK